MKVYVVTSGEYSEYHIEKIFSNQDKAELYQATHKDTNYGIEEYELDEVKNEGTVYYGIVVEETKYGSVDFELMRDIKPIVETCEKDIYTNSLLYTFPLASVPKDNNSFYSSMRKLVKDKIAEYKARAEGVS